MKKHPRIGALGFLASRKQPNKHRQLGKGDRKARSWVLPKFQCKNPTLAILHSSIKGKARHTANNGVQ